jgi:hypothetical protein
MHSLDRQQFCGHRGQLTDVAKNLCRLLHYLRQHPCVDCGESDPVVLDFDHRDASLKRATVSVLIWATSWAVVEQEMARCDVRCANCHRRRTAVQIGWRKNRPCA